MPRLDEFLALHPDIELRLDATNEPPDFARENIDLEIRHGAGPWHGLHVEPLVDEPMEVLCAPKYAAAESLSVAELDGHPLIHSVKNVVQWSDWFQHQGQPMPTQSRRVLFDRAHMSIDLAANGHGLALESRLTAAQELASGRLVPAIRDAKPIIQQSLWLVCPYSHLNRRKVRHFYNWLKSTLTNFPASPAVFKSSPD